MTETFCTLYLTRGYRAKVNWEDIALVEQKWFAQVLAGGRVYAARREGGKTIYLHRQLMGFPNCEVDHRNGDTLDCRRGNLLASSLENSRNKPSYAHNTSGFPGVSWSPSKRKWRARIRDQGRTIHLGYFDTPEEAYAARLAKEKELWGVQPRRAHLFKETA